MRAERYFNDCFASCIQFSSYSVVVTMLCKGMLLIIVGDSWLDPHYGLRVIPQSKVNQYLQQSRLEQWLALGDYASDYRDIPGMGFWHQSDSDRMSFNFVQMNESNFRVLTSTEVLLLIRQIRWKVKVRWWMLVNKERVRQRTKKLPAFNWTLFETFMCTGRYLSTGLSPLSSLLS